MKDELEPQNFNFLYIQLKVQYIRFIVRFWGFKNNAGVFSSKY